MARGLATVLWLFAPSLATRGDEQMGNMLIGGNKSHMTVYDAEGTGASDENTTVVAEKLITKVHAEGKDASDEDAVVDEDQNTNARNGEGSFASDQKHITRMHELAGTHASDENTVVDNDEDQTRTMKVHDGDGTEASGENTALVEDQQRITKVLDGGGTFGSDEKTDVDVDETVITSETFPQLVELAYIAAKGYEELCLSKVLNLRLSEGPEGETQDECKRRMDHINTDLIDKAEKVPMLWVKPVAAGAATKAADAERAVVKSARPGRRNFAPEKVEQLKAIAFVYRKAASLLQEAVEIYNQLPTIADCKSLGGTHGTCGDYMRCVVTPFGDDRFVGGRVTKAANNCETAAALDFPTSVWRHAPVTDRIRK